MTVPYTSNFDETIPFSDTSVQFNLAQNAALTFTVPGVATDKYTVKFAYAANSNVFIRVNTAPTVPGAGTSGTQAYNEFRPGDDGSQRYVQGTDVIHVITPDAAGAYAGMSLRKLPG